LEHGEAFHNTAWVLAHRRFMDQCADILSMLTVAHVARTDTWTTLLSAHEGIEQRCQTLDAVVRAYEGGEYTQRLRTAALARSRFWMDWIESLPRLLPNASDNERKLYWMQAMQAEHRHVAAHWPTTPPTAPLTVGLSKQRHLLDLAIAATPPSPLPSHAASIPPGWGIAAKEWEVHGRPFLTQVSSWLPRTHRVDVDLKRRGWARPAALDDRIRRLCAFVPPPHHGTSLGCATWMTWLLEATHVLTWYECANRILFATTDDEEEQEQQRSVGSSEKAPGEV
jgi:hypothetical protein